MRVYIRAKHGPCGARAYKPLQLSAQRTYSTDEVLAMLRLACSHHTSVDNMFVEYETQTIVVENVAELRVVAACASAYHNSLVKKNFCAQVGFDGLSYGYKRGLGCMDSNVDQCSTLADCDEHDTYHSCDDFDNLEADATQDGKPDADDWDEDKDGDERVYNAEYETHSELGQPWLQDDVDAQEKWGLYT